MASFFLLMMTPLDPPPVKTPLQQGCCIALQVGAQNIGRLMLVPSGIRDPVRLGRNRQKAKETPFSASVPDIAPCASKMSPARLPGKPLITSHRFSGEAFLAVYAPSFSKDRKARSGIVPAQPDDLLAQHPIRKDSTIAQTAVNGDHRLSLSL
jgi:hypothetical protein